MALQKVFSKAVHFYFPTIIPSHVDSVDEFNIGTVLLFKKKPTVLMPWRKHQLQLTGYSLSQLLCVGDTVTPVITRTLVFNTGPALRSRDVQFDVDLELKKALIKLGVLADKKEDKKLTISTDLGNVTHVSSNLLDQLWTRQHAVNPNHPVVQEATSKGCTMFVISRLYSSEKLSLQLTVSKRTTEEAGHGSIKEEVSKDISTSELITRNTDTTIGFLLLKLYVDQDGKISPYLNTGFKSNPNIGDEPDDGNGHNICPPAQLKEELYLHGRLDIHGFAGQSYSEIENEVRLMVAPLVSNPALLEELKGYISLSVSNDKLQRFVKDMHELDDGGTCFLPTFTLPHDLGKWLSEDVFRRKSELFALQMTMEACIEFAPHVVIEMIKLDLVRRGMLLRQIKNTPYGSGTHVYTDAGPYHDPILHIIMIQTGFSMTGNKLMYQHPCEVVDLLAATFVILEAFPFVL